MCPNDILANKKKYMADYNRIKSDDLSYLIINSKYKICDGVHQDDNVKKENYQCLCFRH